VSGDNGDDVVVSNFGNDTLSGGKNNGPAPGHPAPDGLLTVGLERTPVRARGKLLQIRHDCPLTKKGVGHLVLSSAKGAKTVTEMCRKRCLGLTV
jgi:Ca2+-binding RTX toxin-like protein